MDVWRQEIWLVEGSNSHEARQLTASGIIAPDGHLAFRTPRDFLAFAARRWRIDDLGLGTGVDDTVSLIDGIISASSRRFSTPSERRHQRMVRCCLQYRWGP